MSPLDHEPSADSTSNLDIDETCRNEDPDSANSATPIEDHKQLVERTPWRSIGISASLAFCSAVQFSLYFSSAWPYLQVVDDQSTETFYGGVVSAYSVGQILGSPLFGFWSQRQRSIRVPITACLCCSFAGNLLYIMAPAMRDNARWLVLVARFVVGLGAGNIGVLKSYASMASTSGDRSRAIALNTGGIALGAMVGPAIQLMFTPIGYPGWSLVHRVRLNTYTAPAFAACCINVLGVCVMWSLFVEVYAGLDASQLRKRSKSEKAEDPNSLPKYDWKAVFVCYVTFFAQRFTFTNLETLNAPMGFSMFAWSKVQVVRYVGVAHAVVSCFAFVLYMAFIAFNLDRFINLRRQCIGAVAGLVAFHLVTYSWPFLPGKIRTYSEQEYEWAQHNHTEILGCNRDRFAWCETTTPLNVWLFYGAYVLFIGFCFPSINITVNTLFSRILGPRRIGTQQGILQMSGSFARLLGPFLISQLYVTWGPRAAWLLEIIVLSICVLVWALNYHRMVPLVVPDRNDEGMKKDTQG